MVKEIKYFNVAIMNNLWLPEGSIISYNATVDVPEKHKTIFNHMNNLK